MQRFADLLDALSYQPARNGKLRLIEDYLRHAPDPDRGYALAALCGELELPSLKPAALREMTAARVDPELFGWSYDYVGDLAETIALIWPRDAKTARTPPRLSEVVERLRLSGRAEAWIEGVVKLWDLAALKVIVEEAGGSFSDLDGRDTLETGRALATNGRLHEHVLAVLRRARP